MIPSGSADLIIWCFSVGVLSFFFSAFCYSFFFLFFLYKVGHVVVYIELEPSRLELLRLNRILYTQDVIYQICFAFLSTNDIVGKIRLKAKKIAIFLSCTLTHD